VDQSSSSIEGPLTPAQSGDVVSTGASVALDVYSLPDTPATGAATALARTADEEGDRISGSPLQSVKKINRRLGANEQLTANGGVRTTAGGPA